MDPTEHLPISPIYHVIWYNWCTMLWRCTGRAQLQIRVEIHRYSSAGILSLHYVGSNCTTLSFSYRNTNLYLFMLKYPAVGNEAWDTTHNWYEVSWQTPGNMALETLLLPGVFTLPIGKRTWPSLQWETLKPGPYWVLTPARLRVKIS